MARPHQPAEMVTYPALDTLRAVAAIAVLATHAAFWSGAYTHHVWGTALARLDLGVAIFFVLSGFLLSRTWIDRHHSNRPATGRYLWKRLLRLGPVYVLTVTAAMVFLPGNRDAGPGEWVTTLTMTNIYLDDSLPAGLTQMWSLATEVAFYLVLPVLMWLALPRRSPRTIEAVPSSRLGWLLIAMLLTTTVWLLDLSVRWDSGNAMIRVWLPSYLTWFAVGIALAMYDVRFRRLGANSLVRELGRSPGLCWLAAGALFLIASTPLAGPADLAPPTLGAALTKNLLYAAIAGLFVLPAVFAPANGRFMHALSHRTLRHIGHLSYGIFCVHLMLLELLADWRDMPLFDGRGLELFTLTLIASLATSEVVYRGVERPLMRLRDVSFNWPRSATNNAPSVTEASRGGVASAPAQPSADPSGRNQ